MEKGNHQTSCPNLDTFLLIWFLTSSAFPGSKNLAPTRAGSRSSISQSLPFLGVRERLYTSQIFKTHKIVWRRRGRCYSPLLGVQCLLHACEAVLSPIPQYLLIPKRRTPWNWGNLGSSTLSSEVVLMRK